MSIDNRYRKRIRRNRKSSISVDRNWSYINVDKRPKYIRVDKHPIYQSALIDIQILSELIKFGVLFVEIEFGVVLSVLIISKTYQVDRFRGISMLIDLEAYQC